jgi:hypothetical protein
MNTRISGIVFGVAVLVGALSAYLVNNKGVIADIIANHWWDGILWIIGLGLIVSGLRAMATEKADAGPMYPKFSGDGASLLGLFWIILGAALLYAEIADVIWVKQLICRVLLMRYGDHRECVKIH